MGRLGGGHGAGKHASIPPPSACCTSEPFWNSRFAILVASLAGSVIVAAITGFRIPLFLLPSMICPLRGQAWGGMQALEAREEGRW